MNDAELDEVLTFYWPMVIQRAVNSGNEWAAGFAKGIAKKARKRGWTPSRRQEEAMRLLVDEIRPQQPDDIDLVDDTPMSPDEIALQRVRSCFARAETIEPMGR